MFVFVCYYSYWELISWMRGESKNSLSLIVVWSKL
jgi:hypothetical protein